MRMGSATFYCFLRMRRFLNGSRREPLSFTGARVGRVLVGLGQIRFVGGIGRRLCQRTSSEGGVGCCCLGSGRWVSICRDLYASTSTIYHYFDVQTERYSEQNYVNDE